MKMKNYSCENKVRKFEVLLLLLLLAVITMGCQTNQNSTQSISSTSVSTFHKQSPQSRMPTIVTETLDPVTSSTKPTVLPMEMTETPTNSQTIESEVDKLYSDNGGCDFPCWWGFIPGKAKWEDIEQSVGPIASKISITGTQGDKMFSAYFSFSVSSDLSEYPINQMYSFSDGILRIVEVDGVNSPRFRFQTVLQNYGQPTEMWIRTWSNESVDGIPFEVIIYNSNRGILGYFSNRAKIEGDYVKTCFKDETVKSLVLWVPDSSYESLEGFTQSESLSTIPDVSNNTSEENKYLPFEQAIGVNLKGFYEKNIQGVTGICFQTPRSLWKGQFE